MQLNSVTELTPSPQPTEGTILYCGGLGDKRVSNRLFREGEALHAFSISLSLTPHEKILNSHTPVSGTFISESIEELESVGTFFTNFHPRTQSQHCAHEMLFCNLAGQFKYDYLYAKVNEFCCLFESQCANISGAKTATTRKLSQKDKQAPVQNTGEYSQGSRRRLENHHTG